VGEFDLIGEVFATLACARLGHSELAIGDDCALLESLPVDERWAVSTDTLVSGTHFFPEVDPALLGYKALAVNLSDLAAMGARPRAFTLALTLPQVNPGWLRALAGGFDTLACEFDCELVGGDTTQGPLSLTITVFGACKHTKVLKRSAARLGDDIWVSGALGGAALALRQVHTGQAVEPPVRARLEKPKPQVRLGQALAGMAHAAIDVSDGFVQDLGHMMKASGLGAEVHWERIPLDPGLQHAEPAMQQACALAGGDDYELAFTAPPSLRQTIQDLAHPLQVGLSRVGQVIEKPGVRLLHSGLPMHIDRAGFDHFGGRGS
jgi:thiamine-monophosphate kinase